MARDTLTGRLRDQMEREILSGELPPGMKLDEVSLAERFKVSRTPVREALRQLAANDLVVIRPRQTPIVAEMTIKTIVQMFEAMAELEGICARFAARRISAEAITCLEETQVKLRAAQEARDTDTFYEANNEFHEIIYQAAANEYISSQTITLRNRLAPYRRMVTMRPGRMLNSVVEHQLVIDAIVNSKSDEAGRLMSNHVALLGDSMTDFISSLPKSIVD